MGGLLLAFLVPLWRHLPGLALSVQVLLVLLAVPLSLLALGCLASAVRPGILGQLRRGRRRPPQDLSGDLPSTRG